MGIVSPTLQQQQVLPCILSGQNVMLRDQTGSGKSLTLAMAASVKPKYFKNTQINSLVVVPSREIALQYLNWLRALNKTSFRQLQLAISGPEMDRQEALIKKVTPKILVGTPKRILSYIDKQLIDPRFIELAAIDEVDRILTCKNNKKGDGCVLFETLMEQQLQENNKQIVVTSASIDLTTEKYLFDKIPELIKLDGKPEKILPAGLSHYGYYITKNGGFKPVTDLLGNQNDLAVSDTHPSVIDALLETLKIHNISRSIIFVASSVSMRSLVNDLNSRGLKADKLINICDYGGNSIPYSQYLNGQVDFIVASDYECRGLDIPGMDAVVILGPQSPASYLHCAGRAGRFGRAGTVITILAGERYIKQYQNTLEILNIR